jgi:hypothetical protein
MSTLATECMNCGAIAHLTESETRHWMKSHGPGKCRKSPPADLCGLDACDALGFCGARSGCPHIERGETA